MIRRALPIFAAVSVLAAAPMLGAARPPASWDGLTRIDSKRFDSVYLLPGADFRGYTKVMLDPTEVAFEKNWLRDYNNNATFGARLSESEAQRMLGEVAKGFEEEFRAAFAKSSYPITDTPGADVLRVRTAVLNLSVAAPDVMAPGRTRTFAQDAGHASVVVEARDSLTGALLGRAVDSRTIGDGVAYRRNSVTNRADFERVFDRWAKISVEGLGELKARSPISSAVAAK